MDNRRPLREEGSAYLITLLLLVVLTMMGLTLALVTDTEQQIGANERVLERTYYTADAGIGIAAARILVSSDYYFDVDDDDNNSYILNEAPGALATPLTRSRVSVGPLLPTQVAPCNLCEINNAGSYRNNSFIRSNILLPSRAERDTLAEAVARRRVVATMDVQPWRLSLTPFFPLEFMTPAELADKAAL